MDIFIGFYIPDLFLYFLLHILHIITTLKFLLIVSKLKVNTWGKYDHKYYYFITAFSLIGSEGTI